MSPWRRPPSLEALAAMASGTMVEHLDIRFTGVGPDSITATMPADERTFTPFRQLHGGASVVLAETLGSVAANFCVDEGHYAVGVEINANHVRAVSGGRVTGVVTPVHVGRRTQVWETRISDPHGRLACVSRLTIAVVPRPAAEPAE